MVIRRITKHPYSAKLNRFTDLKRHLFEVNTSVRRETTNPMAKAPSLAKVTTLISDTLQMASNQVRADSLTTRGTQNTKVTTRMIFTTATEKRRAIRDTGNKVNSTARASLL